MTLETPGCAILVVDDEKLLATSITRVLAELGHRVVGQAHEGEEAVRMARELRPDLVLMDINLRGSCDGVEAALRIRGESGPALVFLSGYVDSDTIDRALATRPEGYLVKPVNSRSLEAAVQLAVDKRRLEQELRRSHARFRAALAASPDQIARIRADGSLVEEALGAGTSAGSLPPAVSERARDCAAACLEKRAPQRLEQQVEEAPGRRRVYELRAVPIEDAPDEALLIVRDITEQRSAMEKSVESMRMLHVMAQKLQVAREDERKEIARELHDELGQALVGLKLELAACTASLGTDTPQELGRRLDGACLSVDRTIEEIRRITTKLSPLVLDDLGLPAALDWLRQDFERRTGARCVLHCSETVVVDRARASAVFRIAQEALTNAARHAGATQVTMSLKVEPAALVLTVRDNGRGFVMQASGRPEARGLAGIRERAAIWGGEAVLTSAPGKGTMLTVLIPSSAGPASAR